MAILNWRTRRQIIYFGIFVLIAAIIVGGLIWYFWPKPSCSDNKQNQGEEGVDCGGPCQTPCLAEVRDISISWVRFFKNKDGFYDAAALVENPNLFAGIDSLKYKFKLYGANNVLIAIREGSIFINPASQQIIFESNIFTGEARIPSRAFIEFDQQKNWEYIKKEKSFLSIVRKDFINFPFPRLTAEIRNESLADAKEVFAAAVLYDNEGNVQGVSSTKIDLIKPDSTQPANFTWPQPFDKEPASIEVIATTNLTVNGQ